jgi:carboxymethylenebutenolidase
MDGFENDLRGRGLFPETDFSRRGFVMTSLMAGFALATGPVEAQTISTDAAGLDAGEVKIKVPDGEMPAYRAMPASASPFPTVLVVQEAFGVNEHIKDMCRRFAKLGYMAVAPELWARQVDVSKLTDMDVVRATMAKVPDAQVMSDLDQTVAYMKASGRGNTDKLGITGWCWGGRVVWLYAAHSPQLKAGAAWYGTISGPTNEFRTKHPLELATELKAPVLGLYAGQDPGIPVADAEKMREACKAAGKQCELVVYPDAPHGFNADYRPTYRKEAADDGWKRLQDWFKKHGAA